MEGQRAVGERIRDSCLAFMKGGPYIPACSSEAQQRHEIQNQDGQGMTR